MADPVSIVKSNPLLPAEDYVALRKQGIQVIEKVGSNSWTNYNYSDPGITLLEALSYAITDLAYRTGFEIKDLLAPENLTNDTWKEIFYTARQILHNAPLTLSDYRKLIIDVDGVRNAWLTPSKEYEVPVWIDYNAYQWIQETDCSCDQKKQKLCLGSLGLDPDDPTVYAKLWDAKKADLKKQLAEIETKIAALNKEIEKAREIIKSGDNSEDAKKNLEIAIGNKNDYEILIKDQHDHLIGELHLVSRTPLPAKIVEFEGLYNVMVEYEENITDDDERESVRQVIIERLASHRNLCEDFLSVNAVEYELFGIGASFILEEYADSDSVVAEAFFLIYKYFTPSVPFYSIEQMLEKGYEADQIFEGPALKHGFIEQNELDETDFFRDIHLSDLIDQIADIQGLKAITFLHLPFHGFNKDTSHLYFTRWIEFLKQERKIARIEPTLSQVICCKEHDYITYYTGGAYDRRPDRMLKLFRDLKTLEQKYKLAGIPLDLPVPTGEYMNLEDYYPVMYSLPVCYGISERAGLPANADEKRKVQALQLKGYLLFFEQILSGYLVQLNHLKELFTFDDSVKHTYYTRALTEIADLKYLLIDHANHGADHFDKILEDFSGVLQYLVEPPALFYERRNEFLDHMLARFGEDLHEYEALSRWLTPVKVEERLIRDKINMLKDGEYYRISSNRGLGYNYAYSQYWDFANVSGTERRVSRLLGFDSVLQRNLAPDFLTFEPLMEMDDKTHTMVQKTNKKGDLLNIVKFLDPGNSQNVWLTSIEVKDGCCTEVLMGQILTHADNRIYFRFREELKPKARKNMGNLGTFWYELYDDTNPDTAVLLATSERFDTAAKKEKAFEELQAAMQQVNNNEGLHLVEHILLRPKLDIEQDELDNPINVKLLDICLDACDRGIGLGEGIEIPYYKIKITRIPPEKCYDNLPWVLNYLKNKKGSKIIDYPFLFQQVFTDTTAPAEMKFRTYELLTQRIRDLREFGSERINYEIVNNGGNAATLKYGFIIHHGEHGTILAQSLYEYSLKDPNAKKGAADDIEDAILSLMRYFAFQYDLYCAEDPCDNNEDPYSFRTTVVLPCWPGRFRDPSFRLLVEKTIQTESPAHVLTRVMWLDVLEMKRFETAFRQWLQEMAATEMPDYENTNPLVDVLNTLKPCGSCEDECG
jgi:hypothetical protein